MAIQDWKPVVDIFAGLSEDEQNILFSKLNAQREIYFVEQELRTRFGNLVSPASGTLLERLDRIKTEVSNSTNIVQAITNLQTELKGAADSDLTTLEAAINAFKDAFDVRDLATESRQIDGSQRTGVLGSDGLTLASLANGLPVELIIDKRTRATRFVPNTDNPDEIYIGEATLGTSQSVVGWTIRKFSFTYDVDGEVVAMDEKRTALGAAIMDDYLTETYL